jgi:phytoene dehydrogenase-like protein
VAGIFDSGGLVLTNAKVERILVSGGRAEGVQLSDGRRLYARQFVCSSLPAIVTLTRLVTDRDVDAGLRETLAKYHWNEDALFGVHLALREPPRYKGVPPDADLNRALNYCIGYESSAEVERDMRLILGRIVPSDGSLQAGVPTLFDPSQAPPGFATAFAWQFVPSRAAAGDPKSWPAVEAEQVASRMLASWAGYAQNLAGAEIARAILTPNDTEVLIPSMVLGDRHHGSYHPDNSYGNRPHPALSDYRTPVARLYHCGSATHPGGAITGQPGYNAATVIARDLGYDLWWRPPSAHDVLSAL